MSGLNLQVELSDEVAHALGKLLNELPAEAVLPYAVKDEAEAFAMLYGIGILRDEFARQGYVPAPA